MKVFLTALVCLQTLVFADYWSDREKFLREENSLRIGANLTLNDKESEVNQILMNLKLRDFDHTFTNPWDFLPGRHFFQTKKDIEKSEIFQIIKKLPKGGSLHSHDTAIVSQEYLYNLTFRDNLYVCKENNDIQLHFFDSKSIGSDCDWQSIDSVRKSDPSFNNYLKSKLTIICDDPKSAYKDINEVWSNFIDIFRRIGSLVGYKPVFEDYFYQCLKELYEDNVMYLEFRGLLPEVYDLQGKTYDQIEVAGIYVKVLEKFQKDYPKFYGAKFIFAPSRKVGNETIDNYVTVLEQLTTLYPKFIAGFDLVGQEDLGEPLTAFIPKLLSFKNKTRFFFHAGETNWNGETDMNLVDAVLLGTQRIGHGYGILKHPKVKELVKERNIALEVSPISNQVLMLVDDMRNHPANILIAEGFPVVICSDDPTFWGANGLSYDWYMAFMGMASREDDLKLLKQLAMNSILYSSLDSKDCVMSKWEIEWDLFLDKILSASKYNRELDSNEFNKVGIQLV